MRNRNGWYQQINPGDRMREVASFVARNPGRPMLSAARSVAPGPGNRPGVGYGYASVHRAIRAGLVVGSPGPRGSTLLFPVAGVDLSGPVIKRRTRRF